MMDAEGVDVSVFVVFMKGGVMLFRVDGQVIIE